MLHSGILEETHRVALNLCKLKIGLFHWLISSLSLNAKVPGASVNLDGTSHQCSSFPLKLDISLIKDRGTTGSALHVIVHISLLCELIISSDLLFCRIVPFLLSNKINVYRQRVSFTKCICHTSMTSKWSLQRYCSVYNENTLGILSKNNRIMYTYVIQTRKLYIHEE